MPDLRPAPPEFNDRLKRLINAHFPHLQRARIKVEVRDTVRMGKNSTAWAQVDTPDNDAERAAFDFGMWFAWDIWQTLDDYQRDALSFHELMHCGFDKAGKPLLIHHDFEIFNAELALFGLWWGTDAPATLDAINKMPPLHGAEGVNKMPTGYGGYQRPVYGQSGSTGVGQSGSTGVGQSGSTGVGQSGSTGVGQSGSTGVFADPHLQPGADFMNVPIGDGRTLDLCPACYAQLAAFVFNQAIAALGGGDMPASGQSGSTGV